MGDHVAGVVDQLLGGTEAAAVVLVQHLPAAALDQPCVEVARQQPCIAFAERRGLRPQVVELRVEQTFVRDDAGIVVAVGAGAQPDAAVALVGAAEVFQVLVVAGAWAEGCGSICMDPPMTVRTLPSSVASASPQPLSSTMTE